MAMDPRLTKKGHQRSKSDPAQYVLGGLIWLHRRAKAQHPFFVCDPQVAGEPVLSLEPQQPDLSTRSPYTHLTALTLSPLTMSACYNLKGTKSPFDGAQHYPCDQAAVDKGGHSMCCRKGDECMTNGMCYQKYEKERNSNWFFRTAC
jgi:hypothetical protein